MGVMRIALLLTTCALLSMACSGSDGPNEVPFKLYRGYLIVVRGSIGGLKNLNFLVDTGAVPSVVDTRIARKLHLRGRKHRVDVPTKTLMTERVIVHDVGIGTFACDRTCDDRPGPVLRERVIGDPGGCPDRLRRARSILLYHRLRSEEVPLRAGDRTFSTVPYSPGLPYAIVVLQVQQERLTILVDTGASNLVYLRVECALAVFSC